MQISHLSRKAELMTHGHQASFETQVEFFLFDIQR